MWPDPQETADLVTLTEENLHGKLHFLFSDIWNICVCLTRDFLLVHTVYQFVGTVQVENYKNTPS